MNKSQLACTGAKHANLRARRGTRPTAATPQQPQLDDHWLQTNVTSWITDCRVRRLSMATITGRTELTSRLIAFCQQHRTNADRDGVAAFLASLTPGRSPHTASAYHRILRAFFNWCVAQGTLQTSPMSLMKAPLARNDEILPFTDADIRHLLHAATRSMYPARDTALVLFMLDTGLRASELIDLTLPDVDPVACTARIRHGKGDKARSVYYGRRTAKALWDYLREEGRDPDGPVFESERGGPLTRSGLLAIIRRLGMAPQLGRPNRNGRRRTVTTQCIVHAHPHRFRHTFAVRYLMAGGDGFSLQQLMGHTNSRMTQRYIRFAAADLAIMHRQHSPVEHILGQAGRNR